MYLSDFDAGAQAGCNARTKSKLRDEEAQNCRLLIQAQTRLDIFMSAPHLQLSPTFISSTELKELELRQIAQWHIG